MQLCDENGLCDKTRGARPPFYRCLAWDRPRANHGDDPTVIAHGALPLPATATALPHGPTQYTYQLHAPGVRHPATRHLTRFRHFARYRLAHREVRHIPIISVAPVLKTLFDSSVSLPSS